MRGKRRSGARRRKAGQWGGGCIATALAAGLSGAGATAALSEPLVAVVNAANPVEALSLRSLRMVYGGYKRTWPDGTPVRLILPSSGTRPMGFLVGRVFKKSEEAQVFRYYIEAVFQQRMADKPPQMDSRSALEAVGRADGAIAIVPRSEAAGIPQVRTIEFEGG